MNLWSPILEGLAVAGGFVLAYQLACSCARVRREERTGNPNVLQRNGFEYWLACRWYCEPITLRRRPH